MSEMSLAVYWSVKKSSDTAVGLDVSVVLSAQ